MKSWPRAWLGAALLAPAFAAAHPLAPALLELRASAPDRYEVLWRTSVARVRGVDVVPVLPDRCRPVTAARTAAQGGEALETTWTVHCDAGLAGSRVAVAGLAGSGINVVLRIVPHDAPALGAVLDVRNPSYTVPAQADVLERSWSYGALGLEHLLTGLDHVLFVVGLLFVVRGLTALIVAVTAFTLGHSLTLAGATLGFVRFDPALTELGIALSLIAVALAMLQPRGSPHVFSRRPAWLTLGFGLLHGLGFAGALAGIGVPPDDVVPALLAFNLGIEAGQLGIVVVALALAQVGRRIRAERLPHSLGGLWSQRVISRAAPAYIIGSLAACWCIERTVALLA